MAQDEAAGPAGAITEQRPTGLSSRQVEVDLHSREAFEMLRLGEAIVSLRGDLRSLRLEKEELRFDRDRYRASAAQIQGRLTQTLHELDQNRVSRDDLGRLRGEIVQLARECEARVLHERQAVQEQIHQAARESDERMLHERQVAQEQVREAVRESEQRASLEHQEQLRNMMRSHHDELVALGEQHEQEKTAMRDEFHDRLRQAVVSLALECAVKVNNHTQDA